jgi:hypothetical protein
VTLGRTLKPDAALPRREVHGSPIGNLPSTRRRSRDHDYRRSV